MGVSDRHRRDWEDLADVDPFWAVLSDPTRRDRGWEAEREAFYASGEQELDAFLRELTGDGVTLDHGRALDFGCGVGRLTCAMSPHFTEVVGVDHSERMVALARAATAERGRAVTYRAGSTPGIAPGVFDLVWSCLVIQHQPSPAAARQLVGALADRVGPGGVLHIQLPVVLSARRRLQLRRRVYRVGRRLGIRHETLLERFGLNPIRMVHVPEDVMRRILAERGMQVVRLSREAVAVGQVDATVTAVRRSI